MTHNHLLWAGEEKNTLSWKTNVMLMVANPIHFGPLLGINCPSLTFQSPSPPSHPFGPYYMTMTTSTISVFLIRNIIHSLKLKDNKNK